MILHSIKCSADLTLQCYLMALIIIMQICLH